MEHWVRYSGIPEGVLNDNGGEFTADKIREVKSVLNVKDLTTAAESPWQNGMCEKNHQLVDSMLAQMRLDFPQTPDHTLLAWSNIIV